MGLPLKLVNGQLSQSLGVEKLCQLCYEKVVESEADFVL